MEAPKLPSFIKLNRNRSFEFKPRFYSERKERLDELKRKYEREKENSAANADRLREDMGVKWQDARQTKVNSSNRTLLLIIIALLTLTYYIIKF
jgi:hypothetical protein